MQPVRLMEKQFNVYSRSSASGCRVLRHVTRDQGDREVALGKLHRKYDAVGEFIGFQVGLSSADARGDYDLRMPLSFGAIKAREMDINLTRSRTEGLPEDQRLTLAAPEDIAERVHAKVRVYLRVGPARGDIVRVWPRK